MVKKKKWLDCIKVLTCNNYFIENKVQTETGYFVSSGLKRLKGSELCCVTLQRRKHSETEMLDFR